MKLVTRVLLIILVPFLLLYGGFVIVELKRSYAAAEQRFLQRVNDLAEITAKSSAIPLWNFDTNVLKRFARSMVNEPLVVGVLFSMGSEYGSQERKWHVFGSTDSHPSVDKWTDDKEQFAPARENYSLMLQRAIQWEGNDIGNLQLYFTDSHILADLRRDTIGLVTLAAGFIVIYVLLVAWMLHRYVISSFHKVHRVAVDVSGSVHRFRERFEKEGLIDESILPKSEQVVDQYHLDFSRNDEMGDMKRSFIALLDAFSIVINELAQFSREVGEANEYLEVRIADRTRQLEESNQALQESLASLKSTQSQMVQQEKLASIGQLAAGVAHEINNPIGYVTSNINRLREYFDDYRKLVRDVDELLEGLPPEHRQAAKERFTALKEEVDFDFLEEDLPALLDDCDEGSGRVKEIVENLKDFSRSDQGADLAPSDLNDTVQRSLKLVWNELKYDCEVEFEPGELPPVMMNRLQIAQVVSNLLVNAAHAIKNTGRHGHIQICTRVEDGMALLEVSDTGCGIPEDIHSKVFDPFFTTKPVGSGTGLGMNISYDIVVNKHDGKIWFKSVAGQGTTFFVGLPLKAAISESDAGSLV